MFTKIRREDIAWLKELLWKTEQYGCDYSVANLYGWAPTYQTQIARVGGFAAIRYEMPGIGGCYVCPAGAGDFGAALSALLSDARERGEEQIRVICDAAQKESFPEAFTAERREDLDDYLYNAEHFIALEGSHYSAKRNFISQFRREYDNWRFEPMTRDNRADCLAVADAWRLLHGGEMAPDLAHEFAAIERMLDAMEELSLLGGLLYVGKRPIAFALGSCPRPGLFNVHIEKAYADYRGAYAMIAREFAAYAREQTPFERINREEDLGFENLRRAKLSYHPERMDEKYILTAPV